MKLSERMTIRITPSEKILLEGKAKTFKISPSEFVRIAAFNYKQPQTQLSVIDCDTYQLLGKVRFELSKIGTNVNQIAHNANLSLMMGSPIQSEIDELQKISGCLEELVSRLSELKSQINI
jgi:hypothetical protein